MANIDGTGAGETLDGTETADVIRGFDGNDVIRGLGGRDIIDGGAGNDLIVGGAGADDLSGGANQDIFAYTAATDSMAGVTSQDVLADFETGFDVISLMPLSLTAVSIVRTGSASLIFGAGGVGAGLVIGSNRDVNLFDVLTGPVGGPVVTTYLQGSAGADLVGGSFRPDAINGGAGDDTIAGFGESDSLFGGAGADTFAYYATSDSTAAARDTILDFATGVDMIDLSRLTLTAVSIVTSGAASFLFANDATGVQLQVGANGQINGGDLNVRGFTAVTMFGDAGANTLTGGNGADVLRGGDGADTLTGGFGGDTLVGGAGADTFRYALLTDSPTGAADIITDFQSGTDKIDLRGVRTGASDRYGYLVSGGSTFLFVDLQGDGAADLLIQLQGVTNLQTADILF